MDFSLISAVLTAARFGHRRYGTKGALLFGGIAGGLVLLWKRREEQRRGVTGE